MSVGFLGEQIESPYERPSIRFGKNFPGGITPDVLANTSADIELQIAIEQLAIEESEKEFEEEQQKKVLDEEQITIQEDYELFAAQCSHETDSIKRNIICYDNDDDDDGDDEAIISYYHSTSEDENNDDCQFDLSEQSDEYN